MVEFEWDGLIAPLGPAAIQALPLENTFLKKAVFKLVGLDWFPVFKVLLKRSFAWQ